LLRDANAELGKACDYLSGQHGQNAEIREGAKIIGDFSRRAVADLEPVLARFDVESEGEPEALRRTLFPKPRAGGFGLLRDLHALHVLVADAHMATKILRDAARELRDDELHALFEHLYAQSRRQQAWVDTMVKESAAQSLVVPS
jgi:hypothetical protein